MRSDSDNFPKGSPERAELGFDNHRSQNRDVHQFNRYVHRWRTCRRNWVRCEVLALKGRRHKVLLRLMVGKANFKYGYVCMGNHPYSRVGYVGDDFHSPFLFISRRKGNERRVSRGGGGKTEWSSELLKINCAFRWKECDGFFLPSDLCPCRPSHHGAIFKLKKLS